MGSFEPGYEADIVVLDDTRLKHPQELTVQQRLERMIYFSDERGDLRKIRCRNKVILKDVRKSFGTLRE